MTRQVDRRSFILLPLAILAALGLTATMLARGDAPPAAAVGENSLTFPDPATVEDTGAESSMKLDANGFPVVAYRTIAGQPNPGQIRLLHCNDANCAGGDESVEIAFATPFGVQWPSLSLDSAGNPIITFVHFGINVLHCNDANCDGNDESLVVYASCCPSEARHVLAPGDLPVVFFRHNGMQMLRCANTDCTSLSNDSTLLIQPANTYSYSFALDGNGFPVVGYIGNNTASGGDLMLMHCNDLNCDPAVNGPESNLLVDDSTVGGRKVFYHVALALVDGNPVLAYSHFDTSTLKVARCNDPNCAAGGDTIESANTNTGAHSPGIAIDSDGFPVVIYYDSFSRTYAMHCNDASCAGSDENNHLVLSHGSNSPPNTSPISIALDANGIPIASMYKGSGNDLAILHCGDANCSIPPLPTPTNTPTSTSTSAPTATNTPTTTPAPPTATATAGPLGRIAFTTDRNSGFEVFVMAANGDDPTCLTNTQLALNSERPEWSPDGAKLAFSREQDISSANREIFVMDADGTNVVNLTDRLLLDEYPAWSPDGTKIAFTSDRDGNRDIFVMDADGSNAVNLTATTDDARSDEFPVWSPDGMRIAFASFSNPYADGDIYVMDADGSNLTALSNNAANDYTPAWSPDGTKISFASNRDGNNELYVMDAADGGNQVRLTNSPGDDFLPDYSPDGTQMSFTTNRDGNYEIYVMAADGANPTNITNSPSYDAQPSWTGLTPIDPVCPVPEPTSTPTATFSPTNTSTPQSTATNTPIPPTSTNTPIPPTATLSPTNTSVPPTNTLTPTHTPTNTPVPATSTFTPTHTPTSTSVPPTATHTPTNTSVPSTNTPVNTATNTPIPPTATNTASPTATPIGDRCADINRDGRVNVGDMLRIAVHIFRPYTEAHDINRDGQVTIADLFAAARQYGPRRC